MTNRKTTRLAFDQVELKAKKKLRGHGSPDPKATNATTFASNANIKSTGPSQTRSRSIEANLGQPNPS